MMQAAKMMRTHRLRAVLLATLLSLSLLTGVLAEEADIETLLDQIESAEDELAVFHRLEVLAPGRATPKKRRELTDGLIELRQALMHHPDAAPDVLDDNALALRTVIGWQADGHREVELLTTLLEQEIEREQFASARRTQKRLLELLADRSDGDVTGFSSVLPLSARIGQDAVERARDMALRVDDGKLRLHALRMLAKSALKEDRLGTAFRPFDIDGQSPPRAEREAMLADFIQLGAFEPAFFLALLIEADADRDRLLIDIVDHQIEQNQPPETIIAPHAIIDDDLRDAALLALIDDALERERPALARKFAERLVHDDALITSAVNIGGHLALGGYLAQADALLDDLPERLSEEPAVLAQRIHIDLRRGELGDDDAIDRTVARWSDLRQKSAIAAHVETLAVALAKSGRIADLNRFLDETENPAERDALFAGLAIAHVRDNRPSDSLAALKEIIDPTSRAEGTLALFEFLETDDATSQRVFADLMAFVDDALPAIKSAREPDGRIAMALAKQLGTFRAPGDVKEVMAGLPPSQKDSVAAQHALALAETRDGRLLDAVRRLDRLPESPTRARMIIDVAQVLAEDLRFPEATALVDGIMDWSLRAEGYRKIVERQAKKQEADAPVRGGPSARKEADAWRLRAAIPMIEPGRLHVTYLHYAGYGEDFASDLSEIEWLRAAQGTRHPKYIHLESGVFDLPSIAIALKQRDAGDALVRKGRVYTLRLPLLIGPDASLVVSGVDVEALRLAQEKAAYLINAGRFYLADSQLLGWSERGEAIATSSDAAGKAFRPFFLAWSSAETTIAGAHVAGLGYRHGKRSGLSFAVGPALATRRAKASPPASGIIVDSLFEQMHQGVHAQAISHWTVAGNVIRDSSSATPFALPLDIHQADAEPEAASAQ